VIRPRQPAGPAPGVARIRLLGAAGDVTNLAATPETVLPASGVELIDEPAPYANRRDAGERRYLNVRVRQGDQQ
jgi:hypothetical protein